MDDEGHLIPLSKVRGRKKSLNTLVDNMEKQMGSYREENDIVFISHGDCYEDALYVQEQVKKTFWNRAVPDQSGRPDDRRAFRSGDAGTVLYGREAGNVRNEETF